MIRLTVLGCAKRLDEPKMLDVKAHRSLNIFDVVIDLRFTESDRHVLCLLARVADLSAHTSRCRKMPVIRDVFYLKRRDKQRHSPVGEHGKGFQGIAYIPLRWCCPVSVCYRSVEAMPCRAARPLSLRHSMADHPRGCPSSQWRTKADEEGQRGQRGTDMDRKPPGKGSGSSSRHFFPERSTPPMPG